MTINDVALNALALKAKQKLATTEHLMREGRSGLLFQALLDARNACDMAMERMNRMEWPDQRGRDMASDKDYIDCKDWGLFYPEKRRTVAPHWAVGIILAGLVGLLLALATWRVYAEPIVAMEQGGVRIVVYTDKCALPEVKNLPNKAVWIEKGKEVEGCVQAWGDLGVAVFYFSDGTAFPIPLNVFQRVLGS